jgi:hypothetical protein
VPERSLCRPLANTRLQQTTFASATVAAEAWDVSEVRSRALAGRHKVARLLPALKVSRNKSETTASSSPGLLRVPIH